MNEHSFISCRDFKRYTKDDVKIIKKETLYKGFFQCNKYTLQHRLFSGKWSALIEREFFERGNAAAVLAYDEKNDCVILVEQFRFGALGGTQSPWLLELVAGMVKDGESSEDVVLREAFEEAGLRLTSCQFIMNCLVSPGGTTEKVDLFIANVDSEGVKGIYGLSEENEDIRVHVIARETAYQWVVEGKINNAMTVIALQWLELNKKTLKLLSN
ncbi:nucleoside diphosphate pyrophosphatase [Psychromonas sp. CNPT3]|uniref:ADP-ribose diphosphatase n=1 Tax=Psychromonas sp. CNPT3 TaxID=314282 RepID=UPI00006E9537|nr:ADP-ribose diphosphatase [Psychromonas sp. CNPT3]AGH80243.1 nucleoside diphosphate pyrophosphatase [Psychromonas sp. CNPT3]